ncbi:MAG: bifunctional phosphoglucose/phosphomannose isomerase [Candidatus Omnitrophota bacterium]
MKLKAINAGLIKRFDRENMLGLLESFPSQCDKALATGKRAEVPGRYRRKYADIVFAGMGGSGIGGSIIKDYLAGEARVPLTVVKDYTLPGFVGKNTLVFITSYSGDTEETLSVYREAVRKRADIIVTTSGGKAEKIARKNRDMLILIPGGQPPRSALGYSMLPALTVLGRMGIVADKTGPIKRMISTLRKLVEGDLGHTAGPNAAVGIASRIYGRLPVIYTSAHMESVALRWRGQLAENSKVLATCHVLSEMNHNEIEGWQKPPDILKKAAAVFIRDKGEGPEIMKRMAATKDIIGESGCIVVEAGSKGSELLQRIMSAIYIGDFVSFYLSMMNGVDPTPVTRISYLKKKLAGRAK